MRVLAVASEIYPLVKTGGLADVAGALPPALARQGVKTRTLVPGYPAVLKSFRKRKPVHHYADLQGGRTVVLNDKNTDPADHGPWVYEVNVTDGSKNCKLDPTVINDDGSTTYY